MRTMIFLSALALAGCLPTPGAKPEKPMERMTMRPMVFTYNPETGKVVRVDHGL